MMIRPVVALKFVEKWITKLKPRFVLNLRLMATMGFGSSTEKLDLTAGY